MKHYLGQISLALVHFSLVLVIGLPLDSAQAQAPALPEGAAATVIVVESVTGSVQFRRDGRFQRVSTETKLTQGDTIVAEVGSICKLEFQHPTSEAVLAAAILRGQTEMTVAQAYQQGTQSRTQLDVRQGVMRVGVVRTAVPPSFTVRTPQTVLGVRGTEIAEFEVSSDMGDVIRMGQIGTAMVHDANFHFRSVQSGQGTVKRKEGDRRGDTLLRAIENALLENRIFLTGPHRRQLETDFDRNSFDLVEFPGDFWKSEGNAGRDRFVNASGFFRGKCPQCDPTPRRARSN